MLNCAARVKYSVVFCTLAVLLLFLTKPRTVFHDDGTPRHFGLAPGCTLLSIGCCTVLAGTMALFAFAWIDMVFS